MRRLLTFASNQGGDVEVLLESASGLIIKRECFPKASACRHITNSFSWLEYIEFCMQCAFGHIYFVLTTTHKHSGQENPIGFRYCQFFPLYSPLLHGHVCFISASLCAERQEDPLSSPICHRVNDIHFNDLFQFIPKILKYLQVCACCYHEPCVHVVCVCVYKRNLISVQPLLSLSRYSQSVICITENFSFMYLSFHFWPLKRRAFSTCTVFCLISYISQKALPKRAHG